MRRIVVASAWVIAACVHPSSLTTTSRTTTDASPRMPGPYRARLTAAVDVNATCVACHEEEAAEWRRSHHRQSNTNPAYRAAYEVEPSSFCRGCHAPESKPTEDPPTAVSELGVGCVTCHVTDAAGSGAVLAAPASSKQASNAASDAPHVIHRSAEFAATGACRGCHEFSFPGAPADGDDRHLMQTTVREHASSPAAALPCADCHMPARDELTLAAGRRRRRSHAFAEVRDPDWLRKNLHARAERVNDNSVRITLVQPAPGHAYPSGDLFRRLEVGCELKDARGNVLAREARHLARHFAMQPGSLGRQLVRDDRVQSGPEIVELTLPASSSSSSSLATISWWVSYQRVAMMGAGSSADDDVKIESEVPLHSGVLR